MQFFYFLLIRSSTFLSFVFNIAAKLAVYVMAGPRIFISFSQNCNTGYSDNPKKDIRNTKNGYEETPPPPKKNKVDVLPSLIYFAVFCQLFVSALHIWIVGKLHTNLIINFTLIQNAHLGLNP